MLWLLIAILGVIVLLALLVVLVLAGSAIDERALENARIEMEVRRAERRLHDVARDSFAAMLNEARAHERARR